MSEENSDQLGIDYEGALYSIKTIVAENDLRVNGDERSDEQQEWDSTSCIPFPLGQERRELIESETYHGVCSVTKGQRKVMVIKFLQYGEVDAW